MGVWNLFSKRQKRARGEMPDVYAYDTLPQELRVQFVHIGTEVLGDESQYSDRYGTPAVQDLYDFIVRTLRKEYGTFELVPRNRLRHEGSISELYNFILSEENVERVLDAVEMMCRGIELMASTWDYRKRQQAKSESQEAIDEINTRFQEHGVGYRYDGGQIIRIDSELIHAEIVKPALALLCDSQYKGAQAEFHGAHEHYRHRRTKESLADSLKAVESVLKTICKRRGWAYDAGATIKVLIQLVFDKGLIQPFWQSHFTGIRTMLEAGVPTVRNRMGGHGQGPDIVDVPLHIAAFAIHQAAAAIVFLVEADRAMP